MKLYKATLREFERGALGYSIAGIIGQSCLGSVAAMAILMNGNSPSEMFQVFLVTIFCMFFNGSVLAQLKPKSRFNLLLLSIVVSSIFIAVNLW